MIKISNQLAVSALLVVSITFFAFKLSRRSVVHTTADTEINFIENSWSEALKQATAQHKLIFVDAYTSWCGPCRMLKATTFKNDKAAAFYNTNFVNVAIDLEKGDGPVLASRWDIQSIPTLVICDASGRPLSVSVGYIGVGALLKFGQHALKK